VLLYKDTMCNFHVSGEA